MPVLLQDFFSFDPLDTSEFKFIRPEDFVGPLNRFIPVSVIVTLKDGSQLKLGKGKDIDIDLSFITGVFTEENFSSNFSLGRDVIQGNQINAKLAPRTSPEGFFFLQSLSSRSRADSAEESFSPFFTTFVNEVSGHLSNSLWQTQAFC